MRESITNRVIQKAIFGDKTAQGEIFKGYRKRVLNFILQRVENLEDGEEILQETFISVFEALPFYSARSTLLTWICGIARHEVADFYRKKKIKTVVFSFFPGLEGFVSRALSPEGILEQKEAREKIKKILALLAEGYEQVLRLKYIEGFSVAQIAQELDETQKAIESRLTRAREAFGRLYVVINSKSQEGD
ncbi:MAG: sigma-70 family RNA polymerase sigma factor [Candidatus Pacebacteria bacterium]|nr:sigma-70 family RNA polymerase sigma factor [Candidatus Paceibacterota bacterium]